MMFTIAIPNYNYQHNVGIAIESALAQNIDNLEILVSDNNSTDKSWEIINSYKDERLKIYKQTSNLGFLYNWNFLLNKARGKYFKILPSDDWLSADNCEQTLKMINEVDRSNISIVIHNGLTSDCVSDVFKINTSIISQYEVFNPFVSLSLAREALARSMPILNWMNADLMRRNGGYSSQRYMRMDSILFTKVMFSSEDNYILWLKNDLATQLIHNNNLRLELTNYQIYRDELVWIDCFLSAAMRNGYPPPLWMLNWHNKYSYLALSRLVWSLCNRASSLEQFFDGINELTGYNSIRGALQYIKSFIRN